MVPKWMPWGGGFWTILTGIAFVLAGIAMLSGILDVLAARLLALMLLVFSVLVLAPGPLASPHNHVVWGSNAYNLAAVEPRGSSPNRLRTAAGSDKMKSNPTWA